MTLEHFMFANNVAVFSCSRQDKEKDLCNSSTSLRALTVELFICFIFYGQFYPYQMHLVPY